MAETSASSTPFGVLGPLRVDLGGPISLGGRNERAVLARLLLHPGAPVSADELVDGVWRRDRPVTAERTLQSYLSRWRSRLRPIAVRRSGDRTYLLDIDESMVDVGCFRSEIAAARAEAGADPARAVEQYDAALRRWRSVPYPELEEWPDAVSTVRALGEVRASAQEERARLQLDLGHHGALVAELEELVQAEPLRERRWALLMLALARSGRQADALRAFQRARRVLVEELGLEPGPELVDLERRIVARDGSTLAPQELGLVPVVAGGNAPAGAAASQPFIGRARQLALFDAARRDALAGRGSAWAVLGGAGAGKTRLCQELAARAERDGAAVVWGRRRPGAEGSADAPWPEVLNQLEALQADRYGAGHPVADGGPWAFGGPVDRFGRCRAALDVVARAASRRPVVLLIDDVHAVGDDARELCAYVARAVADLAVLLIVTARSAGGDDRGERWAELGVVVELGEFDASEVAELTAVHGYAADGETAELTGALAVLSGGGVARLEQVLRRHRSGEPGSLRAAVLDAVGRAIDGLGPATVARLATMAVLGAEVSTVEAAALAALDEAALADVVAAAVRCGLVVRDGPYRFRFSHGLVRDALLERLGTSGRLDAYARAVEVLGDGGRDVRRAVRRAEFAIAAATRSRADAQLAIDVTRASAALLRGRQAHHQASVLLDRVVSIVRDAQPSLEDVTLLLERAEAALAAGRLLAARAQFEELHELAVRLADPLLVGRAALGMAGMWVEDVRDVLDKRRVAAAQRRALAELESLRAALDGDGDGAGGDRGELRRRAEIGAIRLRVRLAAQAVDWDGATMDALWAALADARACGDPRALCEALAMTANVLLTPEDAVARLEVADELVEVASAEGEATLALQGLLIATAQRFQLADPEAERDLGRLLAQSAAVDGAAVRYLAQMQRVMTLIRAGHLEQGEALAAECLALGSELGDPDALIYYGAQLLLLRWLTAREAETLELFRSFVDSADLAVTDYSAVSACAALAARCGQLDSARSYLSRLTTHGLGALPRKSTLLACLVGVIESARLLGEAAVAKEAYELLEPFASRPVMPSLSVVCYGSAHRWLGLAAATFGDLALAQRHLAAAVADNIRFGNLPVANVCRFDLAELLAAQDDPQAASRAIAMAQTAMIGAEQLGLIALVGRWRRQAVSMGLVRS